MICKLRIGFAVIAEFVEPLVPKFFAACADARLKMLAAKNFGTSGSTNSAITAKPMRSLQIT